MGGNNGGYKCGCPSCGSPMRILSGTDITVTEKKFATALYGQCRNFGCSLSVAGEIAWTHVLKPSQLPESKCQLPLSPYLLRSTQAQAEAKKEAARTKRAAAEQNEEMLKRIEACRANGMTRRETLIETGCTPIQLRKIWPERVAPVRRKIEACRAAGMTRDDARRLVKCDRKTFSAYWPAVPCADTQHA
ncbi:MAG: hypothetical protein FHK79_19075 [Pseudomonas sp.]|nr:MAG: hypothetical protein FHK79_19075 [Pseudomonas sp.]